MTPQSLSIADLNEVIEFINKCPYPTSNDFDLRFRCEQELALRLDKMKYPTEPKKKRGDSMTNMTHPPQEILIKVMCSEWLPSEGSKVVFESKHGEISVGRVWRNIHNEIVSELPSGILDYDTSYWYEPATRVVLTVEEYEAAMRVQYLAGYNDNATPSINP